MKRVAMLFGVAAACCAVPGFALDVEPGSGTRVKAVAAAASVPAAAPAPTQSLTHNPLPDLQAGIDLNGRTFSGACSNANVDLCYDYKENRLVYRPTRNWMPEIGGLKPEHISLRRDSVVFRYSFK